MGWNSYDRNSDVSKFQFIEASLQQNCDCQNFHYVRNSTILLVPIYQSIYCVRISVMTEFWYVGISSRFKFCQNFHCIWIITLEFIMSEILIHCNFHYVRILKFQWCEISNMLGIFIKFEFLTFKFPLF